MYYTADFSRISWQVRQEAPSFTAAELTLEKLDEQFHLLREWARGELQTLFTSLSHAEFTSFESKKRATDEIRRHLRRMELSLACTKCGKPAILKAVVAGNSKNGVFQFDHSASGARSTHGGSGTFPNGLQIVEPLPDGRRRATKAARQKGKR